MPWAGLGVVRSTGCKDVIVHAWGQLASGYVASCRTVTAGLPCSMSCTLRCPRGSTRDLQRRPHVQCAHCGCTGWGTFGDAALQEEPTEAAAVGTRSSSPEPQCDRSTRIEPLQVQSSHKMPRHGTPAPAGHHAPPGGGAVASTTPPPLFYSYTYCNVCQQDVTTGPYTACYGTSEEPATEARPLPLIFFLLLSATSASEKK